MFAEEGTMSTVDEIVAAAKRLDVEQFLRLRKRLDRIEAKVWEAELERTSEELKKAKVTEADIDRIVARRRRESRS
jgi:hypothetical protein